MLKLFFLIGVFVGSLVNLTDAPDTDELKKDDEKVITINTKD